MGDSAFSPAALYDYMGGEFGVETLLCEGFPANKISEATPEGVELKKAWAEAEKAYELLRPKLTKVELLAQQYRDIEDPDDIEEWKWCRRL